MGCDIKFSLESVRSYLANCYELTIRELNLSLH